ncbi:MAG: nuclear transport factor 2 family protein [Chloroflexi bacterium]|nr:nuclear transport factor 2 family protein [Chloroflexota bacterium]
MKGLKVLLFIALLMAVAGQAVIAADNPASSASLGENLEKQMWADIKAKNWPVVEKKIAKGFQSVHEDGAIGRDEEIKLLKGLNAGKYKFSKFKVTQNGPVIVVTYFISVEETIGGKKLSTAPSARQSVWLNAGDGWQWVSHANLNPLKK